MNVVKSNWLFFFVTTWTKVTQNINENGWIKMMDKIFIALI